MKTNKLIKAYEQSVNDIIKEFIIKQYQPDDDEVAEDYFDFWVANEIGTIINIQDFYLSFDDIILDMRTEQPRYFIFEWYNFVIANQEKGYINYKSYTMGLREFPKKDE